MPKKLENAPIPGRLLSTGDIARYCHTGITQVNRWIKNGDLKAFQNPGGHYRITKGNFREFLERNGMPIVEEFFHTAPKRIMIADDDPAVIMAYSLLLKNRYDDVEIETASDGYEALIKTGSFKPDLLILDIRMPKIDGLEVCRRLRKDTIAHGIKILAVTAHSEAYDRDTVLAAGADEYLLKPIEMETLLEYVGKLM
jgi:excisionase family DNA binding protein